MGVCANPSLLSLLKSCATTIAHFSLGKREPNIGAALPPRESNPGRQRNSCTNRYRLYLGAPVNRKKSLNLPGSDLRLGVPQPLAGSHPLVAL